MVKVAAPSEKNIIQGLLFKNQENVMSDFMKSKSHLFTDIHRTNVFI